MSDLDALHREYRRSLGDKRAALRCAWDALCDEAATAQQVAQVHQLLHRLAGSTGTYGYAQIADLARALEQDWAFWLAQPPESRPAPYRVCARQAGVMARFLAALLDAGQSGE